MSLSSQSAFELSEKLKKRETTAAEILDVVLSRIHAVEDRVKAYVTVTEDLAKEQAKSVDEKLSKGETLPALAGIPTAIKDVICTKGVATTCGSKMLEKFNPVYDATVMEKLNAQSIVMTGKANMDEFAMGSSTENSAYYPTANPWDLERVPGGSSGGSAACVAAGEAIVALGSDTGGSIRQPAALCGVVGLKPTYGRVSRYGLVAFASSLDQIGPLANNVRDCALVLQTICGHDPLDSTSAPEPVPDFLKTVQDGLGGLRIGVVKELMAEGLEPGVRQAVLDAAKVLGGLGGQLDEASLPNIEHALSAYYIIAPAEASSNLARYDGVKYGLRHPESQDILEMYGKTRTQGFGEEVKRRIMLGTYALSAGYYEAYYGQAQKIRTLIVKDFEKAFDQFDLLISPTSPTVAFKMGERVADPLKMYLSDICTIPVNLAGIPAISLPCGLSEGLPVGLQIIGPPFEEERVLRAAHAFEQEFGFSERPSV